MQIQVQKVQAFKEHSKAINLNNQNKIQINCPYDVLKEFQKTLKGTQILGATFENPYNGETETFPKKASQLTARHLQVLARNELINTTGKMNVTLYNKALTPDQIGRIRCLVKSTTVAGAVAVSAYGGYHSKNIKFKTPQKMIIIDQSGLQWQEDFRNTGGLVFYPTNPKAKHLPTDYANWQKDMYQAMYGSKRPVQPSENVLKVKWCIAKAYKGRPAIPAREAVSPSEQNPQGVKAYPGSPEIPGYLAKTVDGMIDLDLLANAIEVEFRQALEAVDHQGDLELEEEAAINFKFLKAGMGFFAEGLLLPAKQKEAEPLALARLKGIEQALQALFDLPPQARNLGKIKRLAFPWSYQDQENAQETIRNIENLTTGLGLEWGGMLEEDALTPTKGYVNATTNCGDPHAMIGNEGRHQSVDASISTNADLAFLNPAYNKKINCNITISKNNNTNTLVPLMVVFTIASVVTGVAFLGPAGLAIGGIVGLGCIALQVHNSNAQNKPPKKPPQGSIPEALASPTKTGKASGAHKPIAQPKVNGTKLRKISF